MRISDRALVIAVGVLSVAGFVAGCGGDDDDEDGLTGIDRGKSVASLSQAEATQACDRLVAGFQDVVTTDAIIRLGCTIGGLVDEDTPEACVTVRDECIAEANTQGTPTMMMFEGEGFDDVECDDAAPLAECQGTVGQLETCAEDTFAALRAFLNSVSCDDAATIGATEAAALLDSVESPASCDVVGCEEMVPFGT